MANDRDKALIIVNTGNGKGKTTAALGMVFRTLGYGKKVTVIQFAKGSFQTGERLFSEKIDNLNWLCAKVEHGRWVKNNSPESNLRLGVFVLDEAFKAIEAEAKPALLVLDEFCFGLAERLIDFSRLAELLQRCREKRIDVVLTGRGAPPELIELADTVTVMREVKHAYQSGIPARRGIDF